ncbi:hypothetical protein LCGC14_0541890 [marine sediment metagenome]|uniref:Uncharacterized protein n=1 Tax=marine sediment metagenome TaxID=412755 RepID=A0A0F9SB40_9ZZZZ
MNKEQKEKIESKIKENIFKRKQILEFNNFLEYFKEKEFKEDFMTLIETIRFPINTVEKLHQLRKELKEQLGIWNDELKDINSYWSSFNKDYQLTFIWEGEFAPISIELQVLYGKIPEELKSLKDGCSFEETIIPVDKGEVKTLTYRCKT